MTSSTTPLTITLVDDFDIALHGLVSLLEGYDSRIRYVDVREALAAPAEVDVILYEPCGLSSFNQALLRDLQRSSEAHAVVYSWAESDQLPSSTNQHFPKAMTAAQLVTSLEALVAGRDVGLRRTPAPTAVVDPAPEPEPAVLAMEETDPTMRLTPREREIMTLITSGLTNLEICEELGLSINSIKTYVRQAYRKIGVARRTQAVVWGVEHGLATPVEQAEETAGAGAAIAG